MSSLMILLLILILTIHSSHPSEIKKYSTERAYNFYVKDYRNSSLLNRVNNSMINVIKNYHDFTSVKSKKLRHDLQRLLSTMVKKIIQQRRSRRMKKLKNRRNKENNYIDKMANVYKKSIDEFPVNNHLESVEKIGRDGENYDNVIDRNSGGIRESVSRDFLRGRENLMPLARRNSSSRIRKIRGNSARWKTRINGANENVTRVNSRGKRASETDVWIRKDFDDEDARLKMHALIIKDEDIPPCCSPAKEVSNRRYFMCSGAILTLKHAITTASCLHFADVYKHEVDADLAVLIGATNPRAYVIKITRYDMHPEYIYDVESKNHATHNLAIIYLACSIVAEDAIIPILPKGINDDVGHMCCREGCDLMTIVQGPDNQQIARIIKARNLPAPRHDDDYTPNYRQSSNRASEIRRLANKGIMPNETFPLSRRIGRSPSRLAPAPIFFGKEARTSSSDRSSARSAGKKRRKPKMVETRASKDEQQEKATKEPSNLDDFEDGEKSTGDEKPILKALEEEEANVEEQLAAIDWDKIEETMSKKFSADNRAAMEIFAKNVVNETMRRLEIVLGDNVTSSKTNNGKIFEQLMPGDKKNKTIDSFVKVFTKVVTSLVPPNNSSAIDISMDPLSIEEKDLDDPSPIYQSCPPLGAPIIVDGILVGLLAYTCDDVQSWVEWKYVNIARNMQWIRKKIAASYEPAEKCSGPEKSSRSMAEEEKRVSIGKNFSNGNLTSSRDSEVEWTGTREDASRNFEDSRIAETQMSRKILKDSWLAKNSQPALQPRSNERNSANSRNNGKSTVARHVPGTIYRVNTCYVNEDGSADCQTGTAEFDAR